MTSKLEIETRKNMLLMEQKLLNSKYEREFIMKILPKMKEENKIIRL